MTSIKTIIPRTALQRKLQSSSGIQKQNSCEVGTRCYGLYSNIISHHSHLRQQFRAPARAWTEDARHRSPLLLPHRSSPISTNTKPLLLPLGGVPGSYTRDTTPTASDRRLRVILLSIDLVLPRCPCLECRGTTE